MMKPIATARKNHVLIVKICTTINNLFRFMLKAGLEKTLINFSSAITINAVVRKTINVRVQIEMQSIILVSSSSKLRMAAAAIGKCASTIKTDIAMRPIFSNFLTRIVSLRL